MKKNPRLQFTDAEMGPKLKKHVRRTGPKDRKNQDTAVL